MQGGGGAGISSDNWYGDTDISVIGNLVYDIAPPGSTPQSLIHGIYQIASGTVANNLVHHTTGIGITLWHDAHDIVIANNTVVAALDAGIVVGAGDRGIRGGALSARAGDYVTVANNVVADCGAGIWEYGIVGSHNRYVNNLTFGNKGRDLVMKTGKPAGNLAVAPQFVSSTDFHLKPTSPAVDTGSATFAPATDFDGVRRPQGSAPDRGAFERLVTTVPTPIAWSSADVGAVGKVGSTNSSNGVWTVAGAGADIWGTSDAFRFVSRPMSGDGEIVARVASQTRTHDWAKAGVMIRETLGANARYAMCSLTPGETQLLSRQAPGGASSYTPGPAASTPRWLKLVRVGTTFTAYQSVNGSTWTRIGATTVPMGKDVFVGLAVSSHDVGAVSTAVFDSVSVTAGPAGNG